MTARWVFRDRLNPDDNYTFERNPHHVASPNRQPKLETLGTGVAETIRALQAPDQPIQWEFSGTLGSQAEHDALLAWSQRRAVVVLTDDLGRDFLVLPLAFAPEDASTRRHPWRHKYTFKALLLTDSSMVTEGALPSIDAATYSAWPSSLYVIGEPFPPPPPPPPGTGGGGGSGGGGTGGGGGGSGGGSGGGGGPVGGPILFGSSGGGGATAIAQTTTLLEPNIYRVYDSAQPADWAHTTQARFVPANYPVHYSCKPTLNPSNGLTNTQVGQLITLYGGMPDKAGCRGTIRHEEDNNLYQGGGTPTLAQQTALAAQYQLAWGRFLADVLAPVNSGRTHPIISCPIVTSSCYSRPGGYDLWYVSAADEWGFDGYNVSNIDRAAAYGISKGKPYTIGELGYAAGGGTGTDAQFQARMLTYESHWNAYTYKPACVQWWNAQGNTLTDKPGAAAMWLHVDRYGTLT